MAYREGDVEKAAAARNREGRDAVFGENITDGH